MLNVGLPCGRVLFTQNFDNAADAFAAYVTVQHIKGARIVVLKDSIPEVTLPVTAGLKAKRCKPAKRKADDRKRAGVCGPNLWGWGK